MDRHHDDDLFMFCLCFSFCLCLVNAIQVSTRLSTRLSTRVSTLYVDKGSVYPSVYPSIYTICRQELNYFIFFWSVILIWYFFHIHQEYLRVRTSPQNWVDLLAESNLLKQLYFMYACNNVPFD